MKQTTSILMAIAITLTSITCTAQIKNAKTETVKVYGNCGMCKAKIEKAGTQKNTSKTVWNADSAMATITYDSKKTNQDAILKKIALVGYDNDKYTAPNAVYNNLHGCCQYVRPAKSKQTTL